MLFALVFQWPNASLEIVKTGRLNAKNANTRRTSTNKTKNAKNKKKQAKSKRKQMLYFAFDLLSFCFHFALVCFSLLLPLPPRAVLRLHSEFVRQSITATVTVAPADFTPPIGERFTRSTDRQQRVHLGIGAFPCPGRDVARYRLQIVSKEFYFIVQFHRIPALPCIGP